jgi:fused signal recognition particle receptor
LSERGSWFDRLTAGFRKTSDRLGDNLAGLLTKAQLDEGLLDQIEEALIATDLGPATAAKVRARLAAETFETGLTEARIRQIVAEELEKILRPVAEPLDIDAFPRPQVILVVGVNGSGKTTTIAKLANLFLEQDYSVLLAAGDTFRAAAIEQLRIWADRIGVPVITGPEGGDPSAIVFDGVKKATAEGIDVLIVDMAGRLQNKKGLMDVVLVLDATTGQNALGQIEVFKEVAGVTGLVMTKLDGTARGGVLVAAAEKYGLPIHAIGIGEKMDDLRPFDPAQAARAIAGAAR